MSTERPAPGGPEQIPAGGSAGPEPEAPAPARAEPALPQHTIQPTRTSMVWTMVGIGIVLLVAILVFILQNGQRVGVRFLMVNGTLPLGVALLFAALLGALLVLVAGAARGFPPRVGGRRPPPPPQGARAGPGGAHAGTPPGGALTAATRLFPA